MNTVRKNLIDKEAAKKVITKEPAILEIEKNTDKRTGSFIGMLDGKIGDENYKTIRKKSL